MKEKIVLIDGHSILNRAFYGLPDLTTTKGEHTNAILGFINIMLKTIEEESPKYLTVAFDLPDKTFRHKMFEEYKGTRKGMPEELREQVPVMKEVLEAMKIRTVEKPGFEADDLLGTIAAKAEKEGLEVSILSGDRDLLQLATNNTKVIIPTTKGGTTVDQKYFDKDVKEEYEVTPTEFIDLKGLMGDASDNIPGVPGVGIKTATKLITNYGSIEKLYENIDEMKTSKMKSSLIENKELASLSKELATIKVDCEIDYNIKEAQIDEMFNDDSFEYFKRLEFKNLLSRFQSEIDHSSIVVDKFMLLDGLEETDKIFDKIEKLKKDQYIGLSVIAEDENLLGISICFGKNDIYLMLENENITKDYFKNRLAKLADTEHTIAIIGVKDALKFIELDRNHKIFDNLLAAYLLNPLKSTYQYDDIARDYMDMMLPSKEDFIGKKKLSDVDMTITADEVALLNVCCYDAYIAYESANILIEKLTQSKMLSLYNDIEMPLVYTLFDMEQRGIGINKEDLEVYGENLDVGIKSFEERIYKLAGEEFNINSPKQLGVILFEKLHLPFGKKTKTGYSTAAGVLDKLRGEYEIVDLVLEYRQVAKLKSTYANGLADYISDKGRIHSSFNQTITATGRISSTEPNLQNIPIRMELGRKIRKVFIPREGFVFLDGDYSQIELRVLAHMSGDAKLIGAYKNEDDIHKITASEVFGTKLEDVTDEQRSNAKAVNFGIVYGISAFGLSTDLNITRKEAERYIEQYFATYPRVKEFLDELVESAKEDKYSTTLYGRRRPIPELSSSNFMQRSFGERAAMNSPIQGTAADIIKIAMINLNNRLEEMNMKSSLILQIHDELLIEAHKDEVDEVRGIMREEMERAAELLVPLNVDIKEGNNWYETI